MRIRTKKCHGPASATLFTTLITALFNVVLKKVSNCQKSEAEPAAAASASADEEVDLFASDGEEAAAAEAKPAMVRPAAKGQKAAAGKAAAAAEKAKAAAEKSTKAAAKPTSKEGLYISIVH
jgi:hypothetical protein